MKVERAVVALGLAVAVSCAVGGRCDAAGVTATKLSEAYTAISRDDLSGAASLAREALAANSDGADAVLEADGLLVEAVYQTDGYTSATKTIEGLRSAARGGESEPALLDMLAARITAAESERSTAKAVVDSYSAGGDTGSALLAAERLVSYGTRSEASAALKKIASTPSLHALRAMVIGSALSGGTIGGTGSTVLADESKVIEGLNAFGCDDIESAASVGSSMLSSSDPDARSGALSLLVLASNDQSGYDAAVNRAWSLAGGGVSGFTANRSDLMVLSRLALRLSETRSAE